MSRLRPHDLLRLATVGMRTRKLRAALSVLGISIGIASLVAVLAISETSKGELLAKIETLGTSLLTVGPGESLFGGETKLATAAAGRIRAAPAAHHCDPQVRHLRARQDELQRQRRGAGLRARPVRAVRRTALPERGAVRRRQ